MDQSTTPELPEYLAELIDEADDIFNVLCLVYNETSHDAFRAAVERLMERNYNSTLLDNSEMRAYERDLEKAEEEREDLRGELRTLCERMRALANECEP